MRNKTYFVSFKKGASHIEYIEIPNCQDKTVNSTVFSFGNDDITFHIPLTNIGYVAIKDG